MYTGSPQWGFQLSKYNKHFPFLWQRDFYDSYIITMLTNISMSDRPNYIKIVSILFLLYTNILWNLNISFLMDDSEGIYYISE